MGKIKVKDGMCYHCGNRFKEGDSMIKFRTARGINIDINANHKGCLTVFSKKGFFSDYKYHFFQGQKDVVHGKEKLHSNAPFDMSSLWG